MTSTKTYFFLPYDHLCFSSLKKSSVTSASCQRLPITKAASTIKCFKRPDGKREKSSSHSQTAVTMTIGSTAHSKVTFPRLATLQGMVLLWLWVVAGAHFPIQKKKPKLDLLPLKLRQPCVCASRKDTVTNFGEKKKYICIYIDINTLQHTLSVLATLICSKKNNLNLSYHLIHTWLDFYLSTFHYLEDKRAISCFETSRVLSLEE